MASLVPEEPSSPFWVSTGRDRSTLLDVAAPPLASLPLSSFLSFRRSLILLAVLLSFLSSALSR